MPNVLQGGQILTIDEVAYRVAADPAEPGTALVTAGRQARSLAGLLAHLEASGWTHGDLAADNLLLPGLAPGQPPALGPGAVAVVDWEQSYGPGQDRPLVPPGDSPGYQRPAAGDERPHG